MPAGRGFSCAQCKVLSLIPSAAINKINACRDYLSPPGQQPLSSQTTVQCHCSATGPGLDTSAHATYRPGLPISLAGRFPGNHSSLHLLQGACLDLCSLPGGRPWAFPQTALIHAIIHKAVVLLSSVSWIASSKTALINHSWLRFSWSPALGCAPRMFVEWLAEWEAAERTRVLESVLVGIRTGHAASRSAGDEG